MPLAGRSAARALFAASAVLVLAGCGGAAASDGQPGRQAPGGPAVSAGAGTARPTPKPSPVPAAVRDAAQAAFKAGTTGDQAAIKKWFTADGYASAAQLKTLGQYAWTPLGDCAPRSSVFRGNVAKIKVPFDMACRTTSKDSGFEVWIGLVKTSSGWQAVGVDVGAFE